VVENWFKWAPSNSARDLPAWGGSLSLATDLSDPWHFDVATPAPVGILDFYRIALHEVGSLRMLGVGTAWQLGAL
jgi:hypothetical protein